MGSAVELRQTLQSGQWRQALIAGAALAVGVGLWLHAAGPWAHAGYDFRDYLEGARAVAAGHNPYHGLAHQVSDTLAGESGTHAHGYVYPPLLATGLALPLRLGLGEGVDWGLWALLNALLLLWAGREYNHWLRASRDLAGTLFFTVVGLLPAIALYDLSLGQADLLMGALAVVGCGQQLRGRWWAAGLALGVAIAIKPTLGLLLLVWLWKGDWRAALVGATAGVTLILAPFAPLGWQALQDYALFFTKWNAFHANAEYINQSPYGVYLRALTLNPYAQPLARVPWLVTPLRWLTIGAAVAVWLRAVPRRRARDGAVGLAEQTLALPLIVFISPLAEDIHFCLLIPPLVALGWLAYARGLWRQPAAWVIWATGICCCLPRMQEIIYPTHLFALPGQQAPAIGPVVTLAREGALLWLAVATLVAGAALLRRAGGMDDVAHAGRERVARERVASALAQHMKAESKYTVVQHRRM